MTQIDTNHGELLTIRDHIHHLRQWVQQQKPTLDSLDTDEFLLRFLRVTDFRLEHSKERLINFWRYRTENPQWFKNRDLIKNPLMSQIAQLAYCLQLPKATKEKHLIFVLRMGHYDASIYSIDDVIRYTFAVIDIINSQPASQSYGLILIFDFTEIRLQHLIKFTPDRIRRFIDCWEKIYPVHIRQIHLYNYPPLLNTALYLVRLCHTRTFNDRIYLHPRTSNNSAKKSLQKFIDPSLLPSEYGGQLDSIQTDMNKSFIQWIQERQNYMTQLDQYGIDLKQTSRLLQNVKQEQYN